MADLDRSLTHALITNFKSLTAGDARDPQAITTALLRLKGEELRLCNRIRERERSGGPLAISLAKADRTRLRALLRLLADLRTG
jgi:hypothetical protein